MTDHPSPSEALREAYGWIVRRDDERHVADNACVDCVPDGPLIVPGFWCVPHQARAVLAARSSEPPASPAPDLPTHCALCGGPHLSASVHSSEELRAWEQEREDRKRRAAKVDAHRDHDRAGPVDEASGYPTCSGCGAILTSPAPASPDDPSTEAIRKAITDSYYETSDVGGTMDDVADLAATRITNLLSEPRAASVSVPPPLDVERAIAAIESMKVPRGEHLTPAEDWISVGVVKSILRGTHPIHAQGEASDVS